ncbi:MAG: hypothetical protein DCC68_26675 [Planctomycetota bacterium]|nr:MAG: hypothetical protein DCC68_26675 [Planctomycetota bacterium]
MNDRLNAQRRRSGVTSGTPHADSVQHFLILNVLPPGGSAFGVPVFRDKYAKTVEDYFFGNLATEKIQSYQVHDPFHICCAFGPEEINADNGVDSGDIVLAHWSNYSKRYEVVYPYGLVRPATLSEDLEPGADAAGQIESHDRDGNPGGGIPGVQIYSWQGGGSDTIPSGSKVQVWYESGARRWWTNSFFKEDPPPP